ncbi:MAG: ATP-binding protein [Comamonadaceae bacterium]|nr:ATP-binding protein [Comamonadaceae bacterium]
MDAPEVRGGSPSGQRPAQPSPLVGLPDTEVKEARDRVRAAIQNCALRVPDAADHGQPGAGRSAEGVGPLRPADRAGHPRRQRPDRRRRMLDRYEFAGELSLSGELRPVRGALADGAVQAARQASGRAASCCRRQAPTRPRWWRGVPILAARTLLAGRARTCSRGRASRWRTGRAARGRGAADAAPTRTSPTCSGQAGGQARAGDRRRGRPQRADGRPAGHRQVDAGAAPARHPAADDRRTRRWRRAAVPVAGRRGSRRSAGPTRPFRAPHHTAPRASALVGGGSDPAAGRDLARPPRRAVPRRAARVRPRACWRRCASRWRAAASRVSRAARQVDFPARFQLVAAMNPCPCGYLGHPSGRCRCTPDHGRRATAARICRPVARPHRPRASKSGSLADGELARRRRTASRAAAVARARARGAPTAPDAAAGQGQRRRCGRREIAALLRARAARRHGSCCSTASERLRLSARAYHRMLKVARTIADLDGAAAHRDRPRGRGDPVSPQPGGPLMSPGRRKCDRLPGPLRRT